MKLNSNAENEPLLKPNNIQLPQVLHNSLNNDDAHRREQEQEQEEGSQTFVVSSAVASSISTESDAPGSTNSKFTIYYLTLKTFLGTGILFLPRAITHAGVLMAGLCLAFMALCTYIAIGRLLNVAQKLNIWVYSDIALEIGSIWASRLVKLCLILSQMGFCCAYLVFVAENVVSVLGVFGVQVTVDAVLAYQLIVFIPLSLVRRLEFFSATSGIANLLIISSVIYISYCGADNISQNGLGKGVTLYNPTFPLFIGTAVFSFEGVGMVLPISRTMSSPVEYKTILRNSIIIVTIMYLAVGCISYLSYGDDTQTIILMNLPQTAVTTTFQLLYSLSILLTFPVMQFPILSIATSSILPQTTDHNEHSNGQYAYYTTALVGIAVVLILAGVAYLGSKDLDKFVSLSGGLSCIPLTFIFPSWFSLKHNIDSSRTLSKWLDIAFILLGIVLTVAVTLINVAMLV